MPRAGTRPSTRSTGGMSRASSVALLAMCWVANPAMQAADTAEGFPSKQYTAHSTRQAISRKYHRNRAALDVWGMPVAVPATNISAIPAQESARRRSRGLKFARKSPSAKKISNR